MVAQAFRRLVKTAAGTALGFRLLAFGVSSIVRDIQLRARKPRAESRMPAQYGRRGATSRSNGTSFLQPRDRPQRQVVAVRARHLPQVGIGALLDALDEAVAAGETSAIAGGCARSARARPLRTFGAVRPDRRRRRQLLRPRRFGGVHHRRSRPVPPPDPDHLLLSAGKPATPRVWTCGLKAREPEPVSEPQPGTCASRSARSGPSPTSTNRA
jgi:hypothetical protein